MKSETLKLVGGLGPKLPVDPVIGTGACRIRTGRDDLLAPDCTFQSHLAHQAPNGATRHLSFFAQQAVPHLARTINSTASSSSLP